MGVTKAPSINFSISKIFDLAKVLFELFEWHSYLIGATGAELWQHLSNINVIFNSWHVFLQWWKIRNRGNWLSNTQPPPHPPPLSSCILVVAWCRTDPDSKDHGANMRPTWVLSAPFRPHEHCYQGTIVITLVHFIVKLWILSLDCYWDVCTGSYQLLLKVWLCNFIGVI